MNRKSLGQIMTAVGGTLAAGGVASFFWSNVHLRLPGGGEVTTDEARLVWISVSAAVALAGTALLWGTRREAR